MMFALSVVAAVGRQNPYTCVSSAYNVMCCDKTVIVRATSSVSKLRTQRRATVGVVIARPGVVYRLDVETQV